MATIGGSLKGALMRSMELLGNAADRLATSTRFKVSEMNLSNQRKEILDGLGQKVYQLWQAGVAFPEEICQQLQQVAVLDQQLEEIRVLYRNAQWYWDYCYVENSEGAHNSTFAKKCLATSDEIIMEAEAKLSEL